MVQLKFQQTTAPDFSDVSSILARAGLAQERAFDSAQGLLTKFEEGSQERVDNEVFAEIAGLDREGLQKFLSNNGLKGRPISKALRDRIGSQAGVLADVNQTRQQTASGAATTAINQAAESRTVFGFNRTNADRQSDIDLKAVAIAAEQEKRGLPPIANTITDPGAVIQNAVTDPAPVAPASNAKPPAPTPVTTGQPPDPVSSGSTENNFMGAISAGNDNSPGVKNPYALAAIAATGKHESSFDPNNANATWQDGKNRAGGIMSWNGKRLKSMQDFVGSDKSPEAQAAFFLQEDPELLRRLEGSTSVEEAMTMMNNAWRFKGFDQADGEAASRLETARAIFGEGADTETASRAQLALDSANQTLAASAPGATPPSASADPIAAAAADPADLVGPGGFSLRTPGPENVAGGFATTLPTLTDPANTSGGVLPTSPPTGVPAPLPATAAVPAPVASPATPPSVAADPIAAAVEPPPTPSGNQRSATPAMDAYEAAILADPTIGAKEASNLFADMRTAEAEGVADRKSKRAIRVADQIAGFAIKQAQAPDNHETRSVVLGVIKDAQGAGLSNEEIVLSAEFAADLANGAMSDVVIPKATNNVFLDAIITTALKADSDVINAKPQTRMFALATQFKGAESVTKGIIENLNLNGDGEAPDTWLFGFLGEDGRDENILTDHINEIARLAKVTPAVAAAGMVEKFIRDPRWTNTIAKRFPKDEIVTFLEDNMSADAVARYTSLVLSNKSRIQEFSGERLRLDILQGTFNKMEAGPERKKIGEEISVLRDTLMTGFTSDEGEAELKRYIGKSGLNVTDTLIRALESGNTEIQKEGIQRIKLAIINDKSLSPAERTLLLSTLRR